MAKLQLCVFHYHLLAGGVTDVIMGWLRIVARYSVAIFPQYQEITLRICCGNPSNVSHLRSQWRDFSTTLALEVQQRLFSVEFLVDSELRYRGLPDSEAFYQLTVEQQALSWQAYVQSLAMHLLQQYTAEDQDNLWWIHNYHLGKNIAWTKALLQIIQRQIANQSSTELARLSQRATTIRFLLHIHDFPECGRFARYSELLQSQQWLDFPQTPDMGADFARLYPALPNVCYATINKRDYKILQDAGLPEQNLFFLPNPLEFRNLTFNNLQLADNDGVVTTSKEAKRKQLSYKFNKDFGLPQTENAMMLYPVRCIRRKNLLELAVLNLLAAEPWNLVCTLPGYSEAEKPYSELVENLYHQGVIQGLCHVGLDLEAKGWSFDMLCSAADLVGSSSVMEGFGFTYFNPMYWGKALLARQLDVLQGFEHCFPSELALFYCELKIPCRMLNNIKDPDLAEMYTVLRQKYFKYVATLPDLIRTRMSWELEQHLPAVPPDFIDFALLAVPEQKQILLRLHREATIQTQNPCLEENSLLAACRLANTQLLEQLAGLQRDLEPSHAENWQEARHRSRERIAAEFAPQRLAGILHQACAATWPKQGVQPEEKSESPAIADVSRKVLLAFSKLEYNYAIMWDESWHKGPSSQLPK